MNDKAIGFIGGGHMAASLVGGLVTGGYSSQKIWVADVDKDKLSALEQRFNINTSSDNRRVVESVDILVLAVKPQVLGEVARSISTPLQSHHPLVMSIAAGIREADLKKWLGPDVALVRCMPNTPALVQTGATALHAGSGISLEQRDSAESIMRAVGLTVWVEDEATLDLVTALSGSGPAYFFLFMEALEGAAQELGLERESARLLIQQTALGAAKMALESADSPADLRKHVTSPGGTTERAIEVFEQGKLRNLVLEAVRAATLRSAAMSDELGQH